jgi:hypothetical protein
VVGQAVPPAILRNQFQPLQPDPVPSHLPPPNTFDSLTAISGDMPSSSSPMPQRGAISMVIRLPFYETNSSRFNLILSTRTCASSY